jgi:hypothetical protein
MKDIDVYIICFEINEDFNRLKLIDYLNGIESIYDREIFKDCYLVMCKYDEYVFQKQQKGYSGNEKYQNEIKELIQIEVNKEFYFFTFFI